MPPRPPDFGRAEASRVEKPWGYELCWAVTDRYVGKVIHINKGEALSLQYHQIKDEFQFLVRGSVEMEIGDSEAQLTRHRMQAGDTLHITRGTRHRLTALEDSDIFEVSTPEIDDVVRLEDRYGRAGT